MKRQDGEVPKLAAAPGIRGGVVPGPDSSTFNYLEDEVHPWLQWLKVVHCHVPQWWEFS